VETLGEAGLGVAVLDHDAQRQVASTHD
jgi:hypothetical protein